MPQWHVSESEYNLRIQRLQTGNAHPAYIQAVNHGFGSATVGHKQWNISVIEKAAAEMETRRQQVQKACRGLHINSSDYQSPRVLVAATKAVVYCPVEKTASTFFRRYLFQLEHTDPMRSPFEVPVKLIYSCSDLFTNFQSHIAYLATKQLTAAEKKTAAAETMKTELAKTFLQKSINFLFVRDPFSRLFSAYIDKLYAPNPFHWNIWGKPAVNKHRMNASSTSARCGHDATFEEFLLFVLDMKNKTENMDTHLRPMTELCRPCNINYTVIGHIESFSADMTYLSFILNVTHSQLKLDKMADDSAADAIEDSITDAFTSWIKRITKCMSKFEAGKRIWTKLQHRGVISNDIAFPLEADPKSADNMDADNFIQMAKDARNASKDLGQLLQQKKKAMKNAYREVSLGTLQAIAKMYAADFKIFGFNDSPSDIFQRGT